MATEEKIENNTERFLELFDTLHLNLMQMVDKTVKHIKRDNYSYENFSNLLHKLRFKNNWLNGKNYFFLKTCSKIRNIISHNNHMQPFKEFDESFMIKLESFNARFFSSIHEHAIPKSKINYLNWQSKLKEAIHELKTKNFSYLPILNDGLVEGIFSKSILFDYISEQNSCLLNEEIILEQIKDFAKIENHIDKTVAFVDKDLSLSTVFEMFSEYFQEGKKLILVFITEDGKADQRILGIYTIWDFLKYSE